MSRTVRYKKIKFKSPKTAYTADSRKGYGKFIPDLGRGIGITKLGKLVAKNANRSLKKAVRQHAKLQIRKSLNK